jgi:cell division initiation protein
LTVREAQARAHQMLAESSARVERIQESYEALQEAKRSFTNDFRQLLKTYTEVMDSMEISSAREIEASLRERLDTESIAVAREAASHETAEHTAPEPEGTQRIDAEPTEGVIAEAGSAEDDTATQSIEPETAEPTPQEIDSEIAELEATEPEIDSSTSEEPPTQTTTWDLGAAPELREEPAAVDELAPTDEPAAEEVDSEEPTLAEERSSESFFDREGGGGSSQEGESESRIFRASRFLRRRE